MPNDRADPVGEFDAFGLARGSRATALAARCAPSNLAANLSIHGGRWIFSDRFHFDFDLDLIADQKSAGFQGHIPVQAEVFAIDLCFGGEPRNGLAIWTVAHTIERDVQGNFARLSANGEVAGHREVVAWTRYARADEGDGWVRGDVEEVGRAEVFVSLRIAGDQRRHVNLGFDG